MFKRRAPRSYGRLARDALWPRGGWGRTVAYVKHRLRRLPGSPEQIGRGAAMGVLASFTPLFGLHLILAAVLARLVRGNMVAALFGTFVGNPLTFPLIAVVSMEIGNTVLGRSRTARQGAVLDAFAGAWADLWYNLGATFGAAPARWSGLAAFWDDIFLPYLIGGIGPGVACALASYAATVPVVRAYQRRRAGLAAARLERLRAKARGDEIAG